MLSENEHLKAIREETDKLPLAVMQTDPLQARFIAFLASTLRAERVLELGTFTGHTTLALALAMPENGRLTTCDISPRWQPIARRHWEAAGMSHKIDFRLRSASHVLDTLLANGEAGAFDLVYIDADKDNQDEYYEKSLKLLGAGGVVMIDNILMGGGSPMFTQTQILAAKSLREKASHDPRVDCSLLPLNDGLLLARKI